jgi:glycosyltransferase involved in cell wall biosynthesis
MRIGVDAREIIKGRNGKGWYVFHVLSNILKIDKQNTYFLYSDSEIDLPDFANAQKIILKEKDLLWHLAMPKRLKADKIDLYWAPTSPIVPALIKIPTVFTIHDLTNLLFPQTHTLKGRIIEKIFLKTAIKKAKKIIAVSNATKNDVIKFFPKVQDKIQTTYLGFDQAFRKTTPEECLSELKKRKLKPGYILFVGTLEPRKNVTTILEAYSKLGPDIQDAHPLVAVGSKGWKFGPIFEKVDELKLADKIKFLGYLTPEELAPIYNGASVFVLPSLYEGFGLPPLEAMACGAPVIVSNLSSLPEVVGEAGILVSPLDSDDLAKKITKILSDNVYRQKLSEKSLLQSKKFSWQKTAEETLSIFNEIIR